MIGTLVLLNGLLMLACIPFAWIYDSSDSLHWDFLICSGITTLFGTVMRLSTKSDKDAEIKKRDGYLIVVGGWICMSLFGALPYIISGSIPEFTDAFFETMSGFTTTGSSILVKSSEFIRLIIEFGSIVAANAKLVHNSVDNKIFISFII